MCTCQITVVNKVNSEEQTHGVTAGSVANVFAVTASAKQKENKMFSTVANQQVTL